MPQIAKIKPVRSPSKLDEIPNSPQLDLFGNFWGDAEDRSNTIELWDALPIYSFPLRRQSRIRESNGRLPVHAHSFTYRQRECRIEVQPASIRQKDGSFEDYYPSADEELVEEVLRKIFADQQYGRHDAGGVESWVKFSLQMIAKELRKRGRTRSIDQIKRSIEILSKTHISFYLEDDARPIYMNSILSDVTQVTREEYLNDGSSMSWARLPALISKSINDLTYRQFNYGKLMELKSQLARWLHKHLSHIYTNASLAHPYEVMFSTIQKNSGLLAYVRTQQNVKELEKGLDELKAKGILADWMKEERRGDKNKIHDIKYTFIPSGPFVSDVKAANARRKDSAVKLQKTMKGGR
jgi:hypothetical protein